MKLKTISTLLKFLLVVIIFMPYINITHAFKVSNLTIEPIDDINNIDNAQKVDGLTVIEKDGTMFRYVESESKFIEQTNKHVNSAFVESVDTTWLLLDNLSKEIELSGSNFNYDNEFVNLPATLTQTVLEISPNYAKIQLQDIGTTTYDPTAVSFSNHENWLNAPNLQIQKKSLYPIEENTTLITGEYYQITTNTPAAGADLSNYHEENYIDAIYKAINDVTISSDVKLFANSLEKTTFSNLNPPVNAFIYTDGTLAKSCHEYYDNYTNLDQGRTSGAYLISIDGTKKKYAYCDMSTNGGGWTLVFKAEGGITSNTDPLPIEQISDEQGETHLCLTNLDNDCSAKLSDEDINTLSGSAIGGNKISYMFTSPNETGIKYYTPQACVYDQSDTNDLSTNDPDNHDCRKVRTSYSSSSSPSYTQCEEWHSSTKVSGVDMWRYCNESKYTNVLATGRYLNRSSDYYVQFIYNSGLNGNDDKDNTYSDDYPNSVYMWVRD